MHSQFPLFLTHRTSTVFCSVGCKASKPIGRDALDLLDPFGWLCTWYIKNFSSNLEKSPNMFKKHRSQTFRSKKSLSSYTFQRLWFYEGTIPNNNYPLMSDIFHKPFRVAFKHLDSLRAWNSKKTVGESLSNSPRWSCRRCVKMAMPLAMLRGCCGTIPTSPFRFSGVSGVSKNSSERGVYVYSFFF